MAQRIGTGELSEVGTRHSHAKRLQTVCLGSNCVSPGRVPARVVVVFPADAVVVEIPDPESYAHLRTVRGSRSGQCLTHFDESTVRAASSISVSTVWVRRR